jgi:hypothetical protein
MCTALPGIRVLALLAVLLMVAAMAPAQVADTPARPVVDVVGDGKIDWSKDQVRARGVGFAPKSAKTPGQIAVLAREAALVAAERNLLKVIAGVHVTSETTVENLVLTQDTIRTRVNGLLRGAIIISEKPFGDDGYEVVLAVDLHGETAALAQSIDLPVQLKAVNPQVTLVPAPKPVPQPAPEKAPDGYTGLVIDCRGLELARSMCPRLLDQTGVNLWGPSTVSADLVTQRGIAGYFHAPNDLDIAMRVGKRPLVVKALRASGGKTFKTDAVLSPADAETVIAENAKTLFLDKLNVAFLVDD